MVLFVTLVSMLFALSIVGIVIASVGGAAFLIVYGDVIVCGVIMVLIVKALVKHFKNNKRIEP